MPLSIVNDTPGILYLVYELMVKVLYRSYHTFNGTYKVFFSLLMRMFYLVSNLNVSFGKYSINDLYKALINH